MPRVLTWRILACAAVCTASLAVSLPSTANAYIGIAYMTGSLFHGTTLNVRTDTLYTPNWPGERIRQSNWVLNNQTGNFIEAGIFSGTLSADCSTPSPRAYWADKRPNSSYYCHEGGGANYFTYYGDTIVYNGGNNDWSVGVGAFTGTSTNSITSPNQIEAGTETSNTSSQGCSAARDLYWYDAYGNAHEGWRDTSFGPAIISQSNPPSAYFVDSPTSVSYPSWLRSYINYSGC